MHVIQYQFVNVIASQVSATYHAAVELLSFTLPCVGQTMPCCDVEV